jgi:hypothetical protein
LTRGDRGINNLDEGCKGKFNLINLKVHDVAYMLHAGDDEALRQSDLDLR